MSTRASPPVFARTPSFAVTRGKADLLQLLLEALRELKAAHCVIGGLAVNAYAEPVVSLDLDLVIATSHLDALAKAVADRGMREGGFPHSVNLSSPGSDLRIQLQTDSRYQEFLARAVPRQVLRYELQVAALADVLQGKVWAYQDESRSGSQRQKDLADIARLVEARPDLTQRLPEALRRSKIVCISNIGWYNSSVIVKEVLEAFDGFLADRGLVFEGVVIGGAALILMEIVRRATDDVDCLHPRIPDAIQTAALDFANSPAGAGFSLRKNWFNNGPASLTRDLPPGWLERTSPLFAGRALRLSTLGRLDLLRSKLFAFCDRQEDFDDCIALRASSEELAEIAPWLLERDISPLWPEHVRRSLAALQQEN